MKKLLLPLAAVLVVAACSSEKAPPPAAPTTSAVAQSSAQTASAPIYKLEVKDIDGKPVNKKGFTRAHITNTVAERNRNRDAA